MTKSLVSESMAGLGLASNLLCTSGLASPAITFYNVISSVWVLSSIVLPQPANVSGVWDDSEAWVDTNVWYD